METYKFVTTWSLVLASVCAFLTTGMCAVPSWYLEPYGEAGWVCGKGCADIKDGDVAAAEKEARQAALKDAAASVYCRVSGETISRQSEVIAAGKRKGGEDFFADESRIVTDLELTQCKVLKTEKDKQRVYVLAGVPHQELRSIYKLRVERAMKEIATDFDLAESQREGKPRDAIKVYERCLARIMALADDMKVYLLLNKWQDDISAKLPLPDRGKVEERLCALADRTPRTVAEIADELLSALGLDKLEPGRIAFSPFEFHNSGLVSRFGESLSDALAAGISAKSGWSCWDGSGSGPWDYAAHGNFAELCSGVSATIRLRDSKGAQVNVGQVFISSNTCASIGWDSIRPEKWGPEVIDRVKLWTAITNDERLTLAFQTDKMIPEPVYRFGDEPQMLVKANRECYVSVFDTFSDGRETVVISNYRISPDLANTWVRLPLELVACEPAGIDRLLVQACTTQMVEKATQRVDVEGGGYMDVIVATRGLAKKNNKAYCTERNYKWTVLGKK